MGLPFPPATSRNREDDFNFEKILDHNRALESQLTPAIHANELLEAELRKEMARLESDQQNLADLETNAKKEATFRSENVRNIHSLLQTDTSLEAGDLQLVLDEKGVHHSLDASVRHQRGNFGSKLTHRQIKDDEGLQDLIKHLSSHMESIQGNVKQVDGVDKVLAKTKGAVQARLLGHLDNEQYEAVMLGSID